MPGLPSPGLQRLAAEWSRFLTERDAGVGSGHHESDFGLGDTCTVLAVQEEAIWGREVTWVKSLLTQGGRQDIQEGASQLLPDFWFSLVLFAESERSNILSEAAASPLVPLLGFLQPLALGQEKSQQRSLVRAAGQALNTAGPFRCSATDNLRPTACQHLFTETQHPAVTRAPPPAFPRNPRGRLGFPGPTLSNPMLC